MCFSSTNAYGRFSGQHINRTSEQVKFNEALGVPDINATRDMINDLFSADEVVHSFYHCTETTCNYQKEKGKKKFDHAWIFQCDLTYDATTGLWWLLFIKEKGMYYLLCRLHEAKGKHNKSASYGMEPAVRFQTSANIRTESVQK